MPNRHLKFLPRPDGLRNLGSNSIKTRGSIEEWRNQKPATLRSSDWHEMHVMQHGGSGYLQTHVEYAPKDKVKVTQDIDIKQPIPFDEKDTLRMICETAVQPLLDTLYNKTGKKVWLSEVAAESDHRRLPDGMYKASYHIYIPDFVITASCMNSLYDSCNLPTCVDRVPFALNPGGRRLWRLVGSSKKGSSTFFKPIPITPNSPLHPFHDHLLSYLSGNEIDVTPLFPTPDSRPARRARVELDPVAFPIRVRERQLVRAPFLECCTDGQLERMASQKLEHMHIDCDFGHSRVEGNRNYYDCGPDGRQCKCGRHHDSNRLYVEFTRAGDMYQHCYAQQCAKEGPMFLGPWVGSLQELLDADCWGPTPKVNSRLLTNVLSAAVDATSIGKTRDAKIRNMPEMPWWRKLEETIGRYLSQFFRFIVREAIYIYQTLEYDGKVEAYQAFPRGKIAQVVLSYKWAFSSWEESDYKLEHATMARFCGEPFDVDVEPDEYNLCCNAMPLLLLPYERPSDDEIEQIAPQLEHIRDSLCAGSQEDYEVFMAWVAHVAKHPNKKIGWCPLFIGDQGTGKGID